MQTQSTLPMGRYQYRSLIIEQKRNRQKLSPWETLAVPLLLLTILGIYSAYVSVATVEIGL